MKSDVNNKTQLIELIKEYSRDIQSLGVYRIGFFGSFAKNEMSEKSDVDFFVEFYPQQKSFDNFMNLAFLLEEITSRKIELVTPQSLSPYIGKFILNQIEYVSFAA